MKRRTVLKHMGAGLGYAMAAPAAFSILQSCQGKDPFEGWVPTFLSDDEGRGVARMVDMILPKTDTPSATELGIHQFIDTFWTEVSEEEDQAFTRMIMGHFKEALFAETGAESFADVKDEALESFMGKHLAKLDEATEKAHKEMYKAYSKAKYQQKMAKVLGQEPGPDPSMDAEVSRYLFATSIRDMASWGFKNHPTIAKEVLAYDPIPGGYIACGDVDELTGGKAWSL